MPGVETGSGPKEHGPSIAELRDQLFVQYDFLAELGMAFSFDEVLKEAYSPKRGPERRRMKRGVITDKQCKIALLRLQPELLTMPNEQATQLSLGLTTFVETLQIVRVASDGKFEIPDELKRPPQIRRKPTHTQTPLF